MYLEYICKQGEWFSYFLSTELINDMKNLKAYLEWEGVCPVCIVTSMYNVTGVLQERNCFIVAYSTCLMA